MDLGDDNNDGRHPHLCRDMDVEGGTLRMS